VNGPRKVPASEPPMNPMIPNLSGDFLLHLVFVKIMYATAMLNPLIRHQKLPFPIPILHSRFSIPSPVDFLSETGHERVAVDSMCGMIASDVAIFVHNLTIDKENSNNDTKCAIETYVYLPPFQISNLFRIRTPILDAPVVGIGDEGREWAEEIAANHAADEIHDSVRPVDADSADSAFIFHGSSESRVHVNEMRRGDGHPTQIPQSEKIHGDAPFDLLDSVHYRGIRNGIPRIPHNRRSHLVCNLTIRERELK